MFIWLITPLVGKPILCYWRYNRSKTRRTTEKHLEMGRGNNIMSKFPRNIKPQTYTIFLEYDNISR